MAIIPKDVPRWSADQHFRYERRAGARPHRDEVDLTVGFSLRITAPRSPLIEQLQTDFSRFLRECLGVEWSAASAAGKTLTFRIETAEAASVDSGDSFTVCATPNGATVSAAHERGLLHASHDIERRMALRGGPFLPLGTVRKRRLFDPYISMPMAEDGPNYSLMSHFGVNGLLARMRVWDYCRNRAIPELNTPDYDAKIAALRRRCRDAARYGIDLYLDVCHWGGFPGNGTLFKSRPEIRGAEFFFSVNPRTFDLCSSNSDVLSCYNETFASIFRDVPELGGLNLIVGGEGLMHCFSRPKPPLEGGTSCPHCMGRDPSRDVARLVNGIAQAIHGVCPRARVFAWPYSAHLWSGKDDPAQTQFIANLLPEVCLISNFETPFHYRLGNTDAWLGDYNILNLGPSEHFSKQSAALAAKGMPHYAKTESSTSVFYFSVPYIPVHYRWFERYRRLRECGVPGIFGKWNFYGLTGSLPEELLCEMVWEPSPQADPVLAAAARRDFGDVDVPRLLAGWRKLSRAWERIPIGHQLYGERHGYMKGPFWLGPAHPFIFDAQQDYGLSRKFLKSPPRTPFPKRPRRASFDRYTPHAYCSDLLFTFPFTPAKVERALAQALGAWESGCTAVAQALGPRPAPRAVMELDVCHTITAILRTAYGLVRFYRARDALFTGPGSPDVLRGAATTLSGILDAEIANAESFLPILKRDPRIGYGPYGRANGRVFDAGMVKEKIAQCRYVRDVELPGLVRRILNMTYCLTD